MKTRVRLHFKYVLCPQFKKKNTCAAYINHPLTNLITLILFSFFVMRYAREEKIVSETAFSLNHKLKKNYF